MVNPTLSVIMPVYNEEKTLGRAIDSILSQTFKDFELIIINDHSSDSTFDIINSYKDSRIISINNEVNMGVMQSLNRGLDRATGEFVARMDADDISLLDRFQTQISYLSSHQNVMMCSSAAITIYSDSIKLHKVFDNYTKIIRNMAKENPFVHSTVMFRRCINGEKVYYKEPTLEDYDLWMRIALNNNVAMIDEVLVLRTEKRNLQKRTYAWAKNKKAGIYLAKARIQKKYMSQNKFRHYAFFQYLITYFKYCVRLIMN